MTRPEYIAYIERKRAGYYPSATKLFKKVLNGWTAELMIRIDKAQTPGDLIEAAKMEIKPDELAKAMAQVYSIVGSDFARSTIKRVNERKAAKVELDYWLEYFKIYARTKAAQKIVWITGTTEDIFKRTVNRIVTAAGESGQSVQNMAKQIQDELNFSNKIRATRIARTEVIGASNAGSLEGAKQAGIPLRKEWVPIVDDNSRPEHAAMAGSDPIGLDEPFTQLGDDIYKPGDGDAKDVINCRCGLDFVNELTYDDIINS